MSDISEEDVRALRKQNDLQAFMAEGRRQARAICQHRRQLVLAIPELAAKLTEQPLNYGSPEQWNGFIPPATLSSGAINTTPVRPALLALLHQAEQQTARSRPAREAA